MAGKLVLVATFSYLWPIHDQIWIQVRTTRLLLLSFLVLVFWGYAAKVEYYDDFPILLEAREKWQPRNFLSALLYDSPVILF
jgi:hypothetical protein